MNPHHLAQWNAELRHKTALEIAKWAIAQGNGRALLATNFPPYEAVILHLFVELKPDIPFLWVYHGDILLATYRHSEELI